MCCRSPPPSAQCLLLALIRHPPMSALRPLSGVIRTWGRHRRMTESDTLPGHGFAERNVTEYWIGIAASVRLDVGRPDHLRPLLSFFGNELTEVGGRARKQHAAHFSEPRLDPGISKARVDCVVELLRADP